MSYANAGADQIAAACTGAADGFDLLASLSAVAPNMPAGWTVKQCLGSSQTDAVSNNLQFTQTRDVFRWKSPVVDSQSSLISTRARC